MTIQTTTTPANAGGDDASALQGAALSDAERQFVVMDAADAAAATARGKLVDAMTPGYQAEFTPSEADAAGAFQEDALSEVDAAASTHD
jgi:hypothetical protein